MGGKVKMKKKYFAHALGSEKKYRAKMVKAKKQWLVYGLVFGSLILGGLLTTNGIKAEAATWAPNSSEEIASRILEGQKTITMQTGDTVWNIGVALNIKNPMQLLFDNGYKDGEQYTLPVGTVISWDGNHVTITDSKGKVIGSGTVTDDNKLDPNKTVANQISDEPANNYIETNDEKNGSNVINSSDEKISSGTISNNTSNNKVINTENSPSNEQKPDTNTDNKENTSSKPNENESKPTPEKPVDPEEPQNPTEPENPTDPTLEGLYSQLEAAKAKLAELEQELTQAETDLENAQGSQSELAILQEHLADWSGKLSAAKDEFASKDALAKEAEAKYQAAVQETADSIVVRDEAFAQVEELNTKQAALKDEWTTLKAIIDNAGENATPADVARLAEIEAEITAIDQQLVPLEAALNEAQATVDAKNQAEEVAMNEMNQRNEESADAENRVNRIEAEIASIQAQIDSIGDADIPALEQKVEDLKQAIAKQKELIKELEAKIAVKEFEVAKTQAIKTINGLGYLTNAEKSNYISQVNNAGTKDTVADIVSEAKAKNETNKYTQELAKLKQDVIKQIQSLQYLTSSQQQGYVNQINAVTEKEAVQPIVNAAIQKNNENKATQELKKAKEDAISEVNTMKFLSKDEKEAYIGLISGKYTTTIEQVEQLLNMAHGHNDANELRQYKAKVKTEINALKNLSEVEKTNYDEQLDSASDEKEVDLIVSQAKSQDKQNLIEAKTDVKASLKELEWLSIEEVANFTKQVDNQTTMVGVSNVLSKAQKQNALNEENAAKLLAQVKKDATTEISNMKYLTAEQTTSYLDAVDNATNLKEVNNTLTEARKTNSAAEAVAKLKEEKENGITTVNSLQNVSSHAKQGYVTRINNAKTVEAVKAIVTEAKAADAAIKELNAAKETSKATVNGLEYLTSAQKTHYNSLINSAGTIKEVTNIVNEAKKINTDVKTLAEAKTKVKQTIDGLKNLSASEKQTFKNKVDAATTVVAVNKIISDAKAQDQENAEQDGLDEYKEAAKWKVFMEYAYLTNAQNDAFQVRIDKATTKSQVDAIVKEAKTQNDKNQQEINKPIEDKRKEAQALLKKYWEQGKINGLAYGAFLNAVNQASSIEDLENIIQMIHDEVNN